jgi:metal-responsive CopG/Arc/MetJ family transcriptional regulator
MAKERKIRMTVDLSPQLFERLERLTELVGAESKATVVRDALRLFEYFVENSSHGDRFVRETSSGAREYLHVFGAST